jgi:hypothetical protein
MKRREYIQLIAGSVVAGPLAALAQQPTLPMIVILATLRLEQMLPAFALFAGGLQRRATL